MPATLLKSKSTWRGHNGSTDWDALYREGPMSEMPWYYDALDADLDKALRQMGIFPPGDFLDLGSGPGTQSMALTRMGFKVTGADISQSAVEQARTEALHRGIAIDFRQDDILHSRLQGPYDFIFDRGCFHVLPPQSEMPYVEAVCKLLRGHGHLFLKTFSRQEKHHHGPKRYTLEQIQDHFHPRMRVVKSWDSAFQGEAEEWPHALFIVLQRK